MDPGSQRRASLATRAGIAVLFIVGLAAAWGPLPPHDLWWQMRTGAIIASEHRIPTVDRFSWTAAGEPGRVQEWLAGLIFYQVQSRLGFDGLVLLQFALVAATLAAVGSIARSRGARPLDAMAIATLALWAIRPWLAIRPQLFTYAFLAASAAILESARRSDRPLRLMAIAPLTCLWANLHVGALLAPALLFLESSTAGAMLLWRRSVDPRASDDDKTWARISGVAGMAALAATLATPLAFGLWSYPSLVLGHPGVVDFITEWGSPSFQNPDMIPLGILLAMAFVGLSLGPTRASARDHVLLLLLLAWGLIHRRNLPFFALLSGPLVAVRVAVAAPRGVVPTIALLAAASVILGSGPGVAPLSLQEAFSWQAGMHEFPEAAVRYLQSHPPEPGFFNEYRWGGYLIWRLPSVPVFIDGRAEVYYRSGTFDDYVDIVWLRPGWKALLDRHRIRTVLMERSSALAQVLVASHEWRVAWQDELAVVLVR